MASDQLNRRKVKFVIVDSGAFIKNAPIDRIGENIYTIKEVLSEVIDKNTRDRLQVLPYEVLFREPNNEAIHRVTEFSKKTGDYRSLSAVDLRLIALTYQLEKEQNGDAHIKTEPTRKTNWINARNPLGKVTDIAGFYLDSKQNHETVDKDEEKNLDVLEKDSIQNERLEQGDVLSEKDIEPVSNEEESDNDENGENNYENDIDDGEDDDDDDDDDDEGWITPENIGSLKQKIEPEEIEPVNVTVGCLTSDFAMQNVLIQMGLNVLSVDGLLIKQAKSYVLRCSACMKICTVLTKLFCPSCGNKTLKRITMTVKDDGSIQYHFSSRRLLNCRGLKYSLPLPQGGKHSNNPILFEDQRLPQQRATKKALQRLNVFDENYVVGQSPFRIHDLTSRAAQLGIKGQEVKPWNRRNPNEGVRKFSKKKR
ncbi:RNA-binding protein NOB1 [Octopus vulgaris]|uniref:RNA-binding protein NOB1 n=2 Tax=Octopus vulgaris TaxID=6645 RepID=A0AA36F3G2_OCTVU|nr:RNA-binding protein NOB1 [Octopus vulgaris]